jgi:tetratricopeptide (TPR) repeat protein
LKTELAKLIVVARRAEAIEQLHSVANQFRIVYGIDEPPAQRQRILAQCRKIWDDREFVLEALGSENSAEASRIRADILDLAILMADLQVALARQDQLAAERRQAIQLLDEAEALFGPSPVLDYERQRYATGADTASPARPTKKVARTAWEHYALGRSYLNSGMLNDAVVHLDQARAMEPAGLWSNFYYGLCAFRLGLYDRAANAFSVCIGKAPELAGFYYDRALAYTDLRQAALAVADYDQAILLGENLESNRDVLKHAALNRGILHYRSGNYDQALVDLHRALNERANAAIVHYNLAHVYLAKKDRAAALVSLEQSLACDPTNGEARQMYERLSAKQPSPRPPGSRPSGDGPGSIH